MCAYEIDDRLTITETTAAQRKITMASLVIPGNAASAERKTSMQMKNKRMTAARYVAKKPK